MSAPTPKRIFKTSRSVATVATTATNEVAPSGAADPVAVEGVDSAKPQINSEEIALLAYSFWEARQGQGGSPEEDWLRAEQQIQAGAKPEGEPHGTSSMAANR